MKSCTYVGSLRKTLDTQGLGFTWKHHPVFVLLSNVITCLNMHVQRLIQISSLNIHGQDKMSTLDVYPTPNAEDRDMEFELQVHWKRTEETRLDLMNHQFLQQHADGRINICYKQSESMDPTDLVSTAQAAGGGSDGQATVPTPCKIHLATNWGSLRAKRGPIQ